MARFTAAVRSPASAERTWRVLTDWSSHGRWIPLTDVRVLTPSGAGSGARFVGRTGFGPLGFDDPMEVVVWREPGPGVAGYCRVVKQGRVILGQAWFDVTPTPDGASRVTWTEDVEIAPVALTRWFGPMVAALGRIALTRSLRAMAGELA
ncbi:MAG TPA: SRPBCC family protein [Kineosporiaceae bacterium]|nr:SRPBCC family protein [Kineosporiaceae bacterium]